MVIYCLTNKLNGKQYIGQTSGSLQVRINAHKLADSYIGKALRKWGQENFELEILASAEDREWLNCLEIALIQKHNSLAPFGYNLDSGGKAKSPSASTILKIRKGRKKTKYPLDCQITYRKETNSFRLRVYSQGNRFSLGSFRTERLAYKKYRQFCRGRNPKKQLYGIDFQAAANCYRLRFNSNGKRNVIKWGFKTKHEAYQYLFKEVA